MPEPRPPVVGCAPFTAEDVEVAWRWIDRLGVNLPSRPWDRWIHAWAWEVAEVDKERRLAAGRERHERAKEYLGGNLPREERRKLRGETIAQEVVSRLEGENNALRWYLAELERFVAHEVDMLGLAAGNDRCRLVLPGELVLLRRMALGTCEVDPCNGVANVVR